MRYFRTNRNGANVYGLTDTQGVFYVDGRNGAIAEAMANWPAEGILHIECGEDVGNWLEWIANGSQ